MFERVHSQEHWVRPPDPQGFELVDVHVRTRKEVWRGERTMYTGFRTLISQWSDSMKAELYDRALKSAPLLMPRDVSSAQQSLWRAFVMERWLPLLTPQERMMLRAKKKEASDPLISFIEQQRPDGPRGTLSAHAHGQMKRILLGQSPEHAHEGGLDDVLQQRLHEVSEELEMRGLVLPDRPLGQRARQIIAMELGRMVTEVDVRSAPHVESSQRTVDACIDVHAGEPIISVLQRGVRALYKNIPADELHDFVMRCAAEVVVHDSAREFDRHILRQGRYTGSVFAGDRVLFLRNPHEPLGFSIEIERNVRTSRERALEKDEHGRVTTCYEREGDRITKWSYDAQGIAHFVGVFEGNSFKPYSERVWDYVASGIHKQVFEFQEHIYFTRKGSVVLYNPALRTMREIGTRTTSVPARVRVATVHGEREIALTHDAYIISPKNRLYVSDPTYGLLELGPIVG